MSLTVLCLLCLVQVLPSSSQFVFEVELVAVDVIGECDTDVTDPRLRRCEPVFSIFCLREGRDTQSNNRTDCPLDRNDTRIVAYTPDNINDDFNTRPGLPNGPVTRRIVSQKPWPVRHIIFSIAWYRSLTILFIDLYRGHFSCTSKPGSLIPGVPHLMFTWMTYSSTEH